MSVHNFNATLTVAETVYDLLYDLKGRETFSDKVDAASYMNILEDVIREQYDISGKRMTEFMYNIFLEAIRMIRLKLFKGNDKKSGVLTLAAAIAMIENSKGISTRSFGSVSSVPNAENKWV